MAKIIMGYTYEEFINSIMCVARMEDGGRLTGIYPVVAQYAGDDECKDFDVLCSEGQPAEVRPVFDYVEGLIQERGWMTYPEVWEWFGKEG